jgi:23S rRNA (uridine2552-2'-O)-methyltransferase
MDGAMAYQRKDTFYARAKQAGYRSRAAYKLLELSRRYQLIERGRRVVDLGAWPGGWLQVAAQLTGPSGRVIGVDLKGVEPLGAPVTTIIGDARDPLVQERILAHCGGRVDVLLCDMAPQLTGVRDRDNARALELAEAAVAIGERLLAPGGRLLLKLFDGPEADTVVATARRRFRTVKRTRPEASRKHSAEIYLLCLDFRGDAAPPLSA